MNEVHTSEVAPRVVIDRRPRCAQRHPRYSLWCDMPRGHDGEHESYYGWSGRSESWS